MKKIVIGGSRTIKYLPQSIKVLIDTLAENNIIILVGDANGADKAVQKYLYKMNELINSNIIIHLCATITKSRSY